LADVYGQMVYFKQDYADEFSLPLAAAEAWQDWYAGTPDTPCIAIARPAKAMTCAKAAAALLKKCSCGPK